MSSGGQSPPPLDAITGSDGIFGDPDAEAVAGLGGDLREVERQVLVGRERPLVVAAQELGEKNLQQQRREFVAGALVTLVDVAGAVGDEGVRMAILLVARRPEAL